MNQSKVSFKLYLSTIIIFALISFVNIASLFFISHLGSLTAELGYQYSIIQSKYDVIQNIQTRRDEIMYLSAIHTPQAISILNAIKFIEFYESDTQDLTDQYIKNKIDFPTYWSKVLIFYNEDYNNVAKEIIENANYISELRSKINSWDTISFVYTIFLFPINIVLILLINKKIEKIIELRHKKNALLS